MEAQASAELIISYTVDYSGVTDSYAKLEEALSRGYRVVDIIPTANNAGSSGFVCITVFLCQPPLIGTMLYKKHQTEAEQGYKRLPKWK
jgi:hypothetical protein